MLTLSCHLGPDPPPSKVVFADKLDDKVMSASMLGRPKCRWHKVAERHLVSVVEDTKLPSNVKVTLPFKINQACRKAKPRRAEFSIGQQRTLRGSTQRCRRHSGTHSQSQVTGSLQMPRWTDVERSPRIGASKHVVIRQKSSMFRTCISSAHWLAKPQRRGSMTMGGVWVKGRSTWPHMKWGCECEELGCKNCSHGKNLIGFVFALRALFQKGFNSVGLVYFCAQAPRP